MSLSLQDAQTLFGGKNVQDQRMLAQLAQQAQAARSIPTTSSEGVLAPTPVERQRQKNELWDLKFPDRPKLTPEARIASSGMTAENQWGMAGGLEGIDSEKLGAMNQYRSNMIASRGAYQRAANEAGGLNTPAGREAGMNAISRTLTAEEAQQYDTPGPIKNNYRGNTYTGSVFEGAEGLSTANQLPGGGKIPADAVRAVSDANGNIVGWARNPNMQPPAPTAPTTPAPTSGGGVGTTPRVASELVQTPNLFGTETNPSPKVIAGYEKANPAPNGTAAPSTPGLNTLGIIANAVPNALLAAGRLGRNFFLGENNPMPNFKATTSANMVGTNIPSAESLVVNPNLIRDMAMEQGTLQRTSPNGLPSTNVQDLMEELRRNPDPAVQRALQMQLRQILNIPEEGANPNAVAQFANGPRF
jgi:hypothetical protein